MLLTGQLEAADAMLPTLVLYATKDSAHSVAGVYEAQTLVHLCLGRPAEAIDAARQLGEALARLGFTLVELMVVGAIVMVLAAVAIPQFHTMQLRARAAEVPLIEEGIYHAELSYIMADLPTNSSAQCDYGVVSPFDGAVFWPHINPANIGKTLTPWTDAPEWDLLGFAPDGDVRAGYIADCALGEDYLYCPNGQQANIHIQGVGNVDADSGTGYHVWFAADCIPLTWGGCDLGDIDGNGSPGSCL